MSLRRLLLLLALVLGGTALGLVLYPSASLPHPPVNIRAPRVESSPGTAGVAVALTGPSDWKTVKGAPLQFTYAWQRCGLHGKNCVTLRGAHSRLLVPPQELRIVTLRAVVTARNTGGATSVVSQNFIYDEAGLVRTSRYELDPLVYDPLQLRRWYGLRPSQDGTDQTIVILAPWTTPNLSTAVDRFSALYHLPLVCGTPHAGRNCFELDQQGSGFRLGTHEEQDIEWAHAIAPQARIIVVRGFSPLDAVRAVPDLAFQGDHVFSASWGYWGSERFAPYEHLLFAAIATACEKANVVCTFPSGDRGPPGDRPSNSPAVLAVGGTVFAPTADGSLASEEPWQAGGFGPTLLPQPQPSWQRDLCHGASTSCAYRLVPDVSAIASNVEEYELPPGTPDRRQGWFYGGGTSLSSPLWAALIAIADQQLELGGQPAIGIAELHQVLYRGWLSSGLDGLGQRGWSSRTGWGAPKAGIVDVLVRAIERYRRG